MIGYLDKVTCPLVLKMAKISEYVKAFKVKSGDKDKNNKSVFPYRWWDDLKNIKLFGLRAKI